MKFSRVGISLILISTLFSFSCGGSRKTTTTASTSTTATPTASQPANASNTQPTQNFVPQVNVEEQLKDHALNLGQEFLNKHIVRCKDSFYWRVYRPGTGETLTYEAKDRLETAIKGRYYPPKELSKAQTLNGEDPQPLEWSGYVSIHFSAGRNLGGTWHDDAYVSAEVNRCKGKWYVNAATFPGIKTRSPYGAAEPYGIQSAFEPNSPTQDKFVEIECDK